METLIQMWVYDKRWLCGLPHNPKVVKLIWLVPLLLSSIMNGGALYMYLNHGNGCQENDPSMRKSIFTYLALQGVIWLLTLITWVRQLIAAKENKQQLYEGIEFAVEINDGHDYWHRREAVLSVNAVLIPIVIIISIIWSSTQLFTSYRQSSDICREGAILAVVHAYIQLFFGIVIGLMFSQCIFKNGLPGAICLPCCPQTLICCKKSLCKKKQSERRDPLLSK